jgi:hypothetical protein
MRDRSLHTRSGPGLLGYLGRIPSVRCFRPPVDEEIPA